MAETKVLYKATGVLYRGGRFKPIISSNFYAINGINLYRGSKWISENGGRNWKLMQRVWN